MSCEVRNDRGRVYLDGEVNIYAAALLKEKLLAALRANVGESAIDLSQVTELDTAGLQMLLLARRFSMAGGGDLRLVNPSLAAREVLELCGFGKLIAEWVGDPNGSDPAVSESVTGGRSKRQGGRRPKRSAAQ